VSEATHTVYDGGDRGHRVTSKGARIDADRRSNETVDDFETRLAFGRLDEHLIDWLDELGGSGDPGRATVPTGTFDTYRSDANCYLLPGLGDLWLVDATYARYRDWGDEIVTTKNLGRLKAATRTLDSFITWAFYNDRWPIHVAPFGGKEARAAYRTTKTKTTRRTRRTLNGRTPTKKGKLSLHDCPTIERTLEFGEVLGQAAADRWGEGARCLGDVPIALYATGSRIATGYAFHNDSFSPQTGTVHLVDQIARKVAWTRPRGDLAAWEPPLTLIKQKHDDGYTALLWDEMVPIVEEIMERAESTGGWWFAAAQPDNDWPLDAFERLYLEVRRSANYPFVTQMHRHAYASWSLAPVPDGGHGWDVATVAGCLGDNIDIVTKTYLHASNNHAGRRFPRRRR
jgi:hypothetical protein